MLQPPAVICTCGSTMSDEEIEDGSDGRDEEGMDLMDFIETDRNLDEEKEFIDPEVCADCCDKQPRMLSSLEFVTDTKYLPTSIVRIPSFVGADARLRATAGASSARRNRRGDAPWHPCSLACFERL